MSVSVIMPNYNHGKWLTKSLRALAEQTEPPTEIIVIDDASSDDSIEIIERLRKQYPSIRLVRHERNRGTNAAVTTGIEHATGEFVLFAGADDFVMPELLSHAVSALKAHASAAFFCSEVVLVDKDDRVIGFRPITIPHRTGGYLSPADVRRGIRRSDNWFVGASVVYRRNLLKEIGYFDESLDVLADAMAKRLLAFRHGFCFEPKVLAAWRIDPESYSARAALSATESKQLLTMAASWGMQHYPPDVREEYIPLYDRRLRFNMARLRLVWNRGGIDWRDVSDLANWGPVDRAIVRMAAHVPLISSALVLAWMTIRLRPYHFMALVTALIRGATVNRIRMVALKRTLARKK